MHCALLSGVCVVAGGENGWFKIVRGINNMRFEEECVFALFDVSELQTVLTGRKRGGMFGIVNEKAPATTEVKYNETKQERQQ